MKNVLQRRSNRRKKMKIFSVDCRVLLEAALEGSNHVHSHRYLHMGGTKVEPRGAGCTHCDTALQGSGLLCH